MGVAGRRISLLTVKRSVTAAVVLAVLAGVSLFVHDWYVHRDDLCAQGVTRMEEPRAECVGTTDGSYVFAEHLAAVSGRIERANREVTAGDGKYVTVAYMTSVTVDENDSNPEESVRHELQGAHLAQQRHNERFTPKIRLLIANTGSGSAHWRHTVDGLIGLRDGGEPLVAVTGLGPSTDRNLAALRRLSDAGLATVASTMTATGIGGMEGFVRVAPTNVDEARAAARYLRQKKIRTAMVVQDVAEGNLYADTLGDAFTEEFPRGGKEYELVAERKQFDSSLEDSWRNELQILSNQLCFHRPEAVYFAGRGRHLTHFLDALAERFCTEWDFTVMTGDDTTNLTDEQVRKAADSGVQVFYTGLAHPEMWKDEPDGAPGAVQAAFRKGGVLEQWFGRERHIDGQAMMAHDAVLTAARGAQMASRGTRVTGRAVGRMFQLMEDSAQVRGASGTLTFEENGDAHDKAVPILKLASNGDPVFVTVLSPRG
ncbi:branched-chain amino acid ABC transporter substrate-binding protein [Streptomyces chitinivorans]|uniref:Branched-chain amino acid ABC transporter substrate-binding protein n=1 Tax=Streptomyces chitinivorans TaxID=1257027 RepID=A0ABW7HW11_9ACTN